MVVCHASSHTRHTGRAAECLMLRTAGLMTSASCATACWPPRSGKPSPPACSAGTGHLASVSNPCFVHVQNSPPGRCMQRGGKTNQMGHTLWTSMTHHLQPELCSVAALTEMVVFDICKTGLPLLELIRYAAAGCTQQRACTARC